MSIERISPEEAKERLDRDEGHVYLDVRSSAEFAAGHVPHALNIPLLEQEPGRGMTPNPKFLEQVREKLPKDTKIITACLRGGRSLKAAEMLVADGYSAVVDLRGGYDGELGPDGRISYPGWARRGLPTTHGHSPSP